MREGREGERDWPVSVRLPNVTGRQATVTFRALRRPFAPSLPWVLLAHCTLVATALALWGIALAGADVEAIAGLGLLNALPVSYYLAFALLLVGFAAAVTQDVLSPKVLGLYIVALVIVLHATTPLLYDEPRYPWVYKHLGVINLITATGTVDRTVDIYHNWPGFFAVNAWFSSLTGIAPMSYAEWAQVFFNLANVVAVRFALRGLTRDERLLWTATWLFVLGNWIAEDYLAPQALGFLLTVVVLGLCLRCAPAPRMAKSGPGRWWERRLERFADAMAPRRGHPFIPPRPLSPRAALALGGVCYLAIVVTHQLSPIFRILAVTALSLFGRRVPLWIPAAMLAVEAWWVALAWPFLSEHYLLLSPNPSETGRPEGSTLVHTLPGYRLVVYATIAILALMALLAAAGFVRRLRGHHWELAGASLAVVPVLVVGLQSYNGGAALRAYLFALPWLAFFAAAALSPAPCAGDPGRCELGAWAGHGRDRCLPAVQLLRTRVDQPRHGR